MKRILMALIQIYRRLLSPLKPACCRFYPTCSAYALEAVFRYGALGGGFLALKRILKCHPFHPGGYDPVPETDPLQRRGVHSHGDCHCRTQPSSSAEVLN